MHQPPSALQVHLWEDSIPNLPNGLLSSLPKFFLWHWHQSEGKRSSIRLLDQSSHVSANAVSSVLCEFGPWPLTLTPPICLTSTWLSTQSMTRKVIDRLCFKNGSPAVLAVVMLTSHRNVGFKHFFKLCLIFFCLFVYWKSKYPSELLTCTY